MNFRYRVTILVKASPQPSKSYSETVCCAGIDDQGKWRRLYPIRFRHLTHDKLFSRWSVVEFQSTYPKSDSRWESCHVFEDTLSISGRVKSDQEKSHIVSKGLFGSEKEAISKKCSLALVRPFNVRFSWKKRSVSEIQTAKTRFEDQMKQASLFEDEVKVYEPCPYTFTMHYDDADGPHKKTCGDWETAAAFFKFRKKYDEEKALTFIEQKYCCEYSKKGLVFALGNMAKRPQTWQLLGIFPCAPTKQDSLF